MREGETKKNSDIISVAKDQGTIKNSINHDLDDVNQVNVFYKTEKEPMLQSEIRILKNNQTEQPKSEKDENDYLDQEIKENDVISRVKVSRSKNPLSTDFSMKELDAEFLKGIL